MPFVADREFLPADLEILETPPSPVRMALILIICALVVAALAWSWLGRIDIVAVAQGKIQPTGRVKVIQPSGGWQGRGDQGRERPTSQGRPDLLEMEHGDSGRRKPTRRPPTTPIAPRPCAAGPPSTRRRRALSHAPQISWDADMPQPIQERENQVLAGDLAQLADVVADSTRKSARRRSSGTDSAKPWRRRQNWSRPCRSAWTCAPAWSNRARAPNRP